MIIASDIQSYNTALSPDEQAICDLLAHELTTQLSSSTSKLWHGHPVWFLDGNPVAWYNTQKVGIALLFRSGQSFDEPKLAALGKFKAAQTHYTQSDQINLTDLHRRLDKCKTIQRDYSKLTP
jgi:hypothetical protein